MKLLKIGTEKRQVCYDEKEHLTRLTDYLIRLSGETYKNRKLIWSQNRLNLTGQQFHWDADEQAWFANIETEEEINRLYKVFEGTGIQFDIKPIFRIVD